MPYKESRYHLNYYYTVAVYLESNLSIFSLEKHFILKGINKMFTLKEIYAIFYIEPLNYTEE